MAASVAGSQNKQLGGVADLSRDWPFTGNVDTTQSVSASAGITAYGATSGVGYSSGAGGTVTQLTNKSTGVTLNTPTGQITMNNASLANATGVAFTVTNSSIAANDCVAVSILSGATANTYLVGVQAVAAGSFIICVYNYSGSSQTDTLVLQYARIQGAKS